MSTTDNSPPAAESITGNEDLLTDLLSRLPVRPLIRFKSVSKQWLHLISDRRFSHLHSRLHPKPACSALAYFHRFIPLPDDGNSSSCPPFFSNLESSNLKTLQSCNGLLLLGSLVPTSDFSYFVSNPTTNHIFKLPVPDGNLSIAGVSLAFDPEKFQGYKVICIWKANSIMNQYGVNVYTSETSQWRRAIDCNPESLPGDTELEQGVYCDGKIHWLSHREDSVFFDLESERIRLLPLPPLISEGWNLNVERFCYLGESMGHLHLIEYESPTQSIFNVLELNKETLIWSVKYGVNLDVLGRLFEDDMIQSFSDGRTFKVYSFSVLAVVRAENEDETNMILSIPGKVIKYNFKTRLTNLVIEVGDELDGSSPLKRSNAFQFIESLNCI